MIDAHAPRCAAQYRRVRDIIHFHRLPTYRIDGGFTITGDAGFDESRTDSGERDRFKLEIRECDVLVDIGANIGYFSLLASAEGVPAIAVEPDQRNVQLLLQNIRRNGCEKTIEVIPVALGDQPGILPLFGAGQGASLVEGWGRIKGNYARSVPVITLDRLIGGRFDGQRLLIKMDVEGFELGVLRGAQQTLRRRPGPTWIVENTLTANYADLNPHFAEVFEVFWALGYEARTTEGDLVTPHHLTDWMASRSVESKDVNFLFRPG